ncbi:hypothetical protein AGOR_G00049950 [Albula goreensis]|uniref:Uncharacterized protein n=1 Tax=Albula goreensis TaxID=1534307 RepID=A0A8T3DSN1_9TELE|nr:hypothetical protein AGOR_G00049950 [Albula goreensis]
MTSGRIGTFYSWTGKFPVWIKAAYVTLRDGSITWSDSCSFSVHSLVEGRRTKRKANFLTTGCKVLKSNHGLHTDLQGNVSLAERLRVKEG